MLFSLLLTFSKTAAKLFIFSGNAKEKMQKMHIRSKKAVNMHLICDKYAD